MEEPERPHCTDEKTEAPTEGINCPTVPGLEGAKAGFSMGQLTTEAAILAPHCAAAPNGAPKGLVCLGPRESILC